MKFKYFLRGVGVGIIFASIIFLTVYQENTSKELSDAQIIERAKELGMVEEKNPIGDLLSSEDENSETTEDSLKNQDKSEEKTTEVDSAMSEETQSTEQDTLTVTITVERGSSSYPVCQKLQEMGMIEDASEFDNYLIENGYAYRIRVGTHKLKKGMDFHAIAEAISDPL